MQAQQIETLKTFNYEQSAAAWALLQKKKCKQNPFSLVENNYLTIKTKAGELRPLRLNRAQLRLHSIIKKLWDENKIIRILVLKARQLGISTYIESLIYAITSQNENINSVIISDDHDGSSYIFEMAKLYQEKCPEFLKPNIKKSNEIKLEFDGTHSQILIDTAQNKEAGRKYTFRAVHLSEYAFFPKTNAQTIMLGLSHAVPSLPRTIIIKETTANGFNFFRDEWNDAMDGKNDYTPIFIPWYWGEDYKMPVPDNFVVGDSSLEEISQDEPFLVEQMKKEGIGDIEQRLQWRRWDIRNNCQGDVEKFHQENPSTPEEAFIASGKCFFNQKLLVKQMQAVSPPLFEANIIKENFKYILRPLKGGDFSFYVQPRRDGQYCIGGDAASGSGEDYSVLIARDKMTNEIVAMFRAKCDSDELAYRAMLLGSYLNNAKVGIENDKFGFAANEKLRTIYGNVYVQRSYDKTTGKFKEKFGWNTTSVTRPMMLSQMREEIREESLVLPDKVLIRECLTFIENPETKKAEAEEGSNDDCVIACAISGILRKEEPYKRVVSGRSYAGVGVVDNI